MRICSYIVTITSATADQLFSTANSPQYVRAVAIQADTANAEDCYVGGSTVTTGTGIRILNNGIYEYGANDNMDSFDFSKVYVSGLEDDFVRIQTIAGGAI